MVGSALMTPQRAAGSSGVAPAASRSGLGSGRRSLVVLRAKSTGGAKTTTSSGKPSGPRSATLANPVVDVDKVGFRLNPATNEWMRDDRLVGKVTGDDTVAKPKTGAEYVVWPICHTYLTSKGLKSVDPEQAAELQKKGWQVVDVRLGEDYEKMHAVGAVSLPMYRYVQGTGFWDNVKKGVMAIGFAMRATERDPDFRAKITSVVKKNQKVLLMCSIGGTLDTLIDRRPGVKPPVKDPERAFGRESRSLKAAYELMQAGWSTSNLYWVDGGLQQWKYNGLPIEGTDAK